MDIFGGGWNDYIRKIETGFSTLKPDDICVLCGDISWGMSLEESILDFKFINDLPGKKIVLKGNHDYWWTTTSKMKSFFYENGIENIDILHNNCFFYQGSAICGTRGWLMDDVSVDSHNNKIMARETARLRASLREAGAAENKLCFFHYPPRFYNIVCEDIVSVMNEYGVRRCWYGHIHGMGHGLAVRGEVEGIFYEMVSADFTNFIPQRIM